MSDKANHPPLPEAFKKLGTSLEVLRGLADAGFETPSEIQSLMIPPALDGHDILGQARTGTGKTAAFGIPILCEAVHGYATQALILAPTRELAVQIEAELTMLAKHTKLRVACCYGGDRIAKQMKDLKHSPEIVVGTPGRIMDLLDRRAIDSCNMRFLVLDEVDRMLDIGFRDDIRKILQIVNDGLDVRNRVKEVYGVKINPDYADAGEEEGVPELPDDELQTMFVSATLSKEIEKLARTFMRNDDVKKLVATGADESPTVELVDQCYIPVHPKSKGDLLVKVLETEGADLTIVFTRTKRGAEKLAKRLTSAGFDVRELHGNLTQQKREKSMKAFREKKFDVLVATDVASRGIDVRGVSHIINYDVPEDPEAYVHRIGRTARMGTEGKAYTFVSKEQGAELTRIEMLINMEIPKGQVEGWDAVDREVARVSEEEANAGRGEEEAVAPQPDVPAGPPRRRRKNVGKAPSRKKR